MIRADPVKRTLIERVVGLLICTMLFCLARLCHQPDARAERAAMDEGRETASPRSQGSQKTRTFGDASPHA